MGIPEVISCPAARYDGAFHARRHKVHADADVGAPLMLGSKAQELSAVDFEFQGLAVGRAEEIG